MAKKPSTFPNMVMTLFVVTLLAAALLGSVYALTKEPIRLADLAKKNEAIEAVIKGFDNNPTEQAEKIGMDGDTVILYHAMQNGQYIGSAVETFSDNGFSGRIKLMVGFNPDGTIRDVAVVDHEETPGLGDKMEQDKSDFHVQFQGMHPDEFDLRVEKDNGDVDAITASTISSRAYCEAVKRAWEAFQKAEKATNP